MPGNTLVTSCGCARPACPACSRCTTCCQDFASCTRCTSCNNLFLRATNPYNPATMLCRSCGYCPTCCQRRGACINCGVCSRTVPRINYCTPHTRCISCCRCWVCQSCAIIRPAGNRRCQACGTCQQCCQCPHCAVCDRRQSTWCTECERCVGCCQYSDEHGDYHEDRRPENVRPRPAVISYVKRELHFWDAATSQFTKNTLKRHLSVEIECDKVDPNGNGRKLKNVLKQWGDSVVTDGSLSGQNSHEVNTMPSNGDLFIDHME